MGVSCTRGDRNCLRERARFGRARRGNARAKFTKKKKQPRHAGGLGSRKSAAVGLAPGKELDVVCTFSHEKSIKRSLVARPRVARPARGRGWGWGVPRPHRRESAPGVCRACGAPRPRARRGGARPATWPPGGPRASTSRASQPSSGSRRVRSPPREDRARSRTAGSRAGASDTVARRTRPLRVRLAAPRARRGMTAWRGGETRFFKALEATLSL